MKDYINLSNIPKKGSKYNWSESIERCINGCYKGIEYDFIIQQYRRENNHSEILITINDKTEWIRTNYVVKNVLQQFINPLPDFEFAIGDNINGANRDLTISKRYYKKKQWNGYTYNKKNYDCHCNICGYDNIGIEENSLKKNAMCRCCRGTVLVKGINDIATVYPNSVKYFQGGRQEASKYTRGSQERVYPICPICGRVSTKSYSASNIARKGFSCICTDGFSYPEKYLYNILEQVGVDFIYQATKANVSWIENDYRYDFYIPSMNIVIETDGRQHREDAWKTTADTVKQNDKRKEEYLKIHNIKLIRIDCSFSNNEYISNSIKYSSLVELFDFTNIDYKVADDFASNKSIVVEVCKYKKENPFVTTGEISKKFKISSPTIVRYLKRGVEIGILKEYIPHQHPKATTYQRGKAREVNSKPTYQFDMDGNLLNRYESRVLAAEAVNGCAENITLACKKVKNHKSYKGFLWSDTEYCEPYKSIKHKKSDKYKDIKEKVIELYLKDNTLSTKKIAKLVGVSDTTVGTYLKDASNNGEIVYVPFGKRLTINSAF